MPKKNTLIYNNNKWGIKEWAACLTILILVFTGGYNAALLSSSIDDLKEKMEQQKNDIADLKSELSTLQWQVWQKVTYDDYQYSSFKPIVNNAAKEIWIRQMMIERTGDTRISFNLKIDYPIEYRDLHKQFEQEYIRLFGNDRT